MEPNLALLTDKRSFCLLHRTISRARIRADLTSPFVASCLTVFRALSAAISIYATVSQQLDIDARYSRPASSPDPTDAVQHGASIAMLEPSLQEWDRIEIDLCSA
jgi:hypothetical protein